MEKAIGESQQVSETTEQMTTDTTYAMSIFRSHCDIIAGDGSTSIPLSTCRVFEVTSKSSFLIPKINESKGRPLVDSELVTFDTKNTQSGILRGCRITGRFPCFYATAALSPIEVDRVSILSMCGQSVIKFSSTLP